MPDMITHSATPHPQPGSAAVPAAARSRPHRSPERPSFASSAPQPPTVARRHRRRDVGVSLALLLTLGAAGSGLAAWKSHSVAEREAAAANQPEPVESVSTAIAEARAYRPHTTSIGTVLALRSVTLSNELPGTVRQVNLAPGAVVEAGTVLVALDVSVEEAELRAFEAQAALAEATLARMQRLVRNRAAPEADLERAQAERDVARAQIARAEAIIARKTIRAPFRARIGLADVHPGQFLEAGTVLTTLQGLDEAVHVDFAVAQQVASTLRIGDAVQVFTGASHTGAVPATIVATDARVDARTRNALVRARLEDASRAPAPGASVRVRVPTGPAVQAAAVPADALRKGPGGDQLFVITPDSEGRARAHLRRVQSGSLVGDEVLILSGLAPGEQVATAGSFKLRENVLIAAAPERTALASAE